VQPWALSSQTYYLQTLKLIYASHS